MIGRPVVWWGVYNGDRLVVVRRLARDARAAAAKYWSGGWQTCTKQGWRLKRVYIEPAMTTHIGPWPKAPSPDLFSRSPSAIEQRGE